MTAAASPSVIRPRLSAFTRLSSLPALVMRSAVWHDENAGRKSTPACQKPSQGAQDLVQGRILCDEFQDARLLVKDLLCLPAGGDVEHRARIADHHTGVVVANRGAKLHPGEVARGGSIAALRDDSTLAPPDTTAVKSSIVCCRSSG